MSDPPADAQPLSYDRLAADYARHRRVHPGVVRRLIETGHIGDTSRVLEVGCGSGNYLLALRRLTGCMVWGIDPSREMLARASAQPDANEASWHKGRAEALPFPDAAFDLVFSVDVIHHLERRPAFFSEARRVLVPDGRVCTVTDSAEDIYRRRPLTTYWPETVAVELARYPSIDTIEAELIAAGFNDLLQEHVDLPYDLVDAAPYRARAFSSLHLIPDDAFARGLAKLEADLAIGPISALSLYTLIWGA